MIKEVFVVYDSKAEFYKNPFMCDSKGEAVRMFSDVSNDEKTEIGKHPEDFTLFHIGQYDMRKGEYKMKGHKESIGVAIEFVRDLNKLGYVADLNEKK